MLNHQGSLHAADDLLMASLSPWLLWSTTEIPLPLSFGPVTPSSARTLRSSRRRPPTDFPAMRSWLSFEWTKDSLAIGRGRYWEACPMRGRSAALQPDRCWLPGPRHNWNFVRLRKANHTREVASASQLLKECLLSSGGRNRVVLWLFENRRPIPSTTLDNWTFWGSQLNLLFATSTRFA